MEKGARMDKPPLLYEDLEPGRAFKPFVLEVTRDFVNNFCGAVRDENPVYFEPEAAKSLGLDRPVAPAAIAGIFGRRSYLEEYSMPPGGILVRQEFDFTGPVYVGDSLTASAEVVERYGKKGRKYVAIQTIAKNQDGDVVGTVRFTAIWPE